MRKPQNWKPQALLMKTEKKCIDNRSMEKNSNKTSINRQLTNKKTLAAVNTTIYKCMKSAEKTHQRHFEGQHDRMSAILTF
jgi:hypothetical protein